MDIFDITASIVLYKNDKTVLRTINSFFDASVGKKIKLFLIDNSPTDELREITSDIRTNYIHNPRNPGFGTGHNIGTKQASGKSKYYLILNPDIYFDGDVLNQICEFMDNNPNIGVLMPKILYPDNSIQYVAKLLPTPFDFIVRRFVPYKKIKEKLNYRFELRHSGYDKIMDVPFLSGCFMIFKMEVLEKINGFDENIFMYTEDIDICRRVIDAGYRSVYYPKVCVHHNHEPKSFTDFKTFKVYLRSAIYYFNKWGWFFDIRRRIINKRTLSQL